MVKINNSFLTETKKPWFSSKEFNFLLYCSRIVIDQEVREKIKSSVDYGLDWPNLVNKAEVQGVAQFLYLHLSGREDVWSIVPEEFKDRLKKYYYVILTKNWLMQKELQNVISILKQASIEVIVLKGASLLETVYKNIALRPMEDVDLLVKRNDLSRIKSILQDAGYKKPDFLDLKSLEKFGGEIHLYKEKGIFLDIHTNLSQYERFGNVFEIDLDEELWTKSEIINTREGKLRILNPAHLIMHLCLHHAIAHSFVGLYRFCDLRETILTYQKDIDWQNLIVKAQRYKIKKIIYYCLQFTQELFGEIALSNILKILKAERKKMILSGLFISKSKILSLPDREPGFKKCIYQLFLMDNPLDIPMIILKGLFPSNDWIRYRYATKKKIYFIFYRLFHPIILFLNIGLQSNHKSSLTILQYLPFKEQR